MSRYFGTCYPNIYLKPGLPYIIINKKKIYLYFIMNITCDCKTITIMIILALLLALLFGVLIFRVNKQKKEDCGCDNPD